MRPAIRLLLLLIVAATASVAAHADILEYSFVYLPGDFSPIEMKMNEKIFFLPATVPEANIFNYDAGPPEEAVLRFFDVPVVNITPDGTTFTELENINFISPDGDGAVTIGGSVIDTEEWTYTLPPGTTFIAGSYASPIDLGEQLFITAVSTPEPSTFVLLGTGFLGLAGAARSRFQKKKS